MTNNAHNRVTRGDFQYHDDGSSECPDCERRPVVKMMLDDENLVHGLARTHFCRREPINFSIGVQVWSGPRKQYVYAIRACSSHANYHVHWWHHLKVNEVGVDEKFKLDSREDVKRAYVDASANVFPRFEDWRARWAARK